MRRSRARRTPRRRPRWRASGNTSRRLARSDARAAAAAAAAAAARGCEDLAGVGVGNPEPADAAPARTIEARRRRRRRRGHHRLRAETRRGDALGETRPASGPSPRRPSPRRPSRTASVRHRPREARRVEVDARARDAPRARETRESTKTTQTVNPRNIPSERLARMCAHVLRHVAAPVRRSAAAERERWRRTRRRRTRGTPRTRWTRRTPRGGDSSATRVPRPWRTCTGVVGRARWTCASSVARTFDGVESSEKPGNRSPRSPPRSS